MKIYLDQTKFATQKLIEIINHDLKKLNNIQSRLDNLPATLDAHKQAFELHEFSPDANHYYAIAMKAYDDKDKIQKELYLEMAAMLKEKDTNYHSICALSGALLQIAKQGISTKYGRDVKEAPKGELLRGVPLRDIVWEGRNQSLHYEDCNPHAAVKSLFKNLKMKFEEFGTWEPWDGTNYAARLIEILGWSDYDQYHNHMNSLS